MTSWYNKSQIIELSLNLIMKQYVAPSLRLRAFNCPNCGAYANQDWKVADYKGRIKARLNSPRIPL
jgi:hypothetical protein